MKALVPILGLVTSINGIAVTALADPVPWPFGYQTSRSMNTGLLNGTDVASSVHASGGFSPNDELVAMPELVLAACAETFSICMPDTRVDAMLMVTDQTTLIGHLTLDQYASLREIAAVTEMYVTEGTLTVRFIGGAWPGSLLSVFEAAFPL